MHDPARLAILTALSACERDQGRGAVESYWKEMEEIRESAARWQARSAALRPVKREW